MREPGEILPTVYVLEDRKLPDGEWATTDGSDLFETIEGAEDTAKEWREMEYDDGKYDVRIAKYRRVGVVDPTKDTDEPTLRSRDLSKKPGVRQRAKTITQGELELAGIPVKLERFTNLGESVIQLAEEGAFGELFETCEDDCDCVVCELRVLLGYERGHKG